MIFKSQFTGKQIEKLLKGSNLPYIGANGHWYLYSIGREEYVDTQISALGPPGPEGSRGVKGDAAKAMTILGLYHTIADLEAVHPTGAGGDAYAIGTEESNVIYTWDVNDQMWKNLGPLQGIPGPPGADGAKGDKGEEGIPKGGADGQFIMKSEPDEIVWAFLKKDMIGLGNVDNTSDHDKPISTAQQIVNTQFETEMQAKSNKSKAEDMVLLAELWQGEAAPYTYIYTNENILSGLTPVEVISQEEITPEQLDAFQGANIVGGQQEEGYTTLLSFGDKPGVDIPVTFIIRGDM